MSLHSHPRVFLNRIWTFNRYCCPHAFFVLIFLNREIPNVLPPLPSPPLFPRKIVVIDMIDKMESQNSEFQFALFFWVVVEWVE